MLVINYWGLYWLQLVKLIQVEGVGARAIKFVVPIKDLVPVSSLLILDKFSILVHCFTANLEKAIVCCKHFILGDLLVNYWKFENFGFATIGK